MWTEGRLGDETGSSLVEVTVAMVVLALAIIPMVGMMEAGLRAATASGDYDAARALANERLEEARALPYSKPGGAADSAVELYAPPGPPVGAEDAFTYATRTAFVDEEFAETPSPTRQMLVEVTVAWKGGSYAATGTVSGASP